MDPECCFLIDGVLDKNLLSSVRRPGGCTVVVPDEAMPLW